MSREALLLVPSELAQSLASGIEWSGRWRFTSVWRGSALERIGRSTELPDCLVLHLRSMEYVTAAEILRVARRSGLRVGLAADYEAPQLRLLTGLMQSDGVELVSLGAVRDGRYQAFFDGFPRLSVHSQLFRLLSPRLARLPDPSLVAACRSLVPMVPNLGVRFEVEHSGTGNPHGASWGGGRTLERHLSMIGLGTNHGFRRAARLATAIDLHETQGLKRPRLARVAGFLSERTLASTARDIFGMSIREALVVRDGISLAVTLAEFCRRSDRPGVER